LGTLHTLGVTQGKAPAKQKEKGKHLWYQVGIFQVS
jgi:hypothetical protein